MVQDCETSPQTAHVHRKSGHARSSMACPLPTSPGSSLNTPQLYFILNNSELLTVTGTSHEVPCLCFCHVLHLIWNILSSTPSLHPLHLPNSESFPRFSSVLSNCSVLSPPSHKHTCITCMNAHAHTHKLVGAS